MSQETQPGELSSKSVARIIDLKLPLPWLLGCVFAIIGALTQMYFKLDELGRNVTALQITVNSGNTATTNLQSEIAILRFRVETLESSKRPVAGVTR